MTEPATQRITDAKVLAAMSHPLRRRLMDALALDGPSTASMLAARTEQAVGNVSHHMKALHVAGLAEQAPELARDRRERWWRLAARTRTWASTDFADDPVGAVVAAAAASQGLDDHTRHVRRWWEQEERYDPAWLDAAFSTDTWLQLTPAELVEFSVELGAVLGRWRDREIPDDDAAREPVFVFAHGNPATP